MTLAVSIAQSGANNVTMRNRIINGAMVIDQRNAGASVTPSVTSSQYLVDRWGLYFTQASRISAQQVTDAPTGFRNSLRLTVASVGTPSGNEFGLFQKVEGFNFADLMWGTANAQAATISFWVKSSVTGTHCVAFTNQGAGGVWRSYPATYTINSANTWEQKTITVLGDTSGTWPSDNTTGLYLWWDLGSTSADEKTGNTWSTGVGFRTSSTVLWVTNAGATFQITGVQLEEGTTATAFEQRLYGTELALCQRYFFSIVGDGTTNMMGTAVSISSTQSYICFPIPVQMRTYPTMTQSLCVVSDLNTYDLAISAINNDQSTLTSGGALVTHASGATIYRPQMLYIANASAYMRLSAEL